MSPTLPGRPGNLTAEQEARLQELWTVTLRVFGVQAPDRPEDVEHQQQSGSLTATPDKKAKKKKNSIFRRHNGDNDEGASADQEDKYGQGKDFQQVLATVDPEKLRNAFWSMVKHDHPDGLLLRFLRARKWDVHNALVMLIATMNWRMKEQRVDDDIMKNGEGQAAANSSSSNAAVNREAEDFLAQLRLGKSFLHGTDREGRPMCFVRVRLHKQGEQSNTSLERYTVYTIETARLLLASNVDTAVGYSKKHVKIPAYDLAGDRLRYDWFLNGQHGVWNIIKGWLDPVVASKVHFTKNLDELERFVEKSHIIKELGGDDPYEYQYVEFTAGENEKMSDESTREQLVEERARTVKEYEKITQEWIADSQNRATLQQRRNDLAERLRSGYWQLDPYVRARSLYDRVGLIQGGVIQHYAESETSNAPKAPAAVPQNGPLPTEHRADDVD
ncbi:MAG: hypothetical protein Q9206_000022 [Seirophora lacunosa]